MSIWDDITSGMGSFFGNGGAQLVSTGAGLIANNQASRTVTSANMAALDQLRQSQAQARADLLASKAKSEGFMEPFVEAGQGPNSYLRGVAASDPSRLTPIQQIGLSDLQRRTQNNLATSALRGSGRAGQAVLADATGRYIAGAQNTNQGRVDAVNSTLNNQGYGASGHQANSELGFGSNIANIGLTGGQQAASTTQNNALTGAATSLANARLLGSGIGSVGAYFDRNRNMAPTQSDGGDPSVFVDPNTGGNFGVASVDSNFGDVLDSAMGGPVQPPAPAPMAQPAPMPAPMPPRAASPIAAIGLATRRPPGVKASPAYRPSALRRAA